MRAVILEYEGVADNPYKAETLAVAYAKSLFGKEWDEQHVVLVSYEGGPYSEVGRVSQVKEAILDAVRDKPLKLEEIATCVGVSYSKAYLETKELLRIGVLNKEKYQPTGAKGVGRLPVRFKVARLNWDARFEYKAICGKREHVNWYVGRNP